MKARLTAGLIHKATRGELALTLPTGLVRTSQGTVQKIPNQEAQARLSLVFETFLQCRSASKVVEVFNTHDLLLPRRNRFGDLVWKAPRVAAVLILKHPAYAGAFTYGRTHCDERATRARLHHPSAPGAVAHLHPGRLPTFHQLGDVSPGDHAQRQSRRV